MADPILNRDATLHSPAWTAEAVTPDDNADLPRAPTRGIYVGSTGDVKVTMAGGGAPVVFAAVQAGTWLPIRVDRVHDSGTEAEDIVALY